ncbi:MAG: hypothetical protein MRY83_01365 [Flavobacteriales bacterium]|nr:hypothetical protein [Flavobacteriales bacterium]
MKAASLVDIKRELKTRNTSELNELVLRLAKYKKENKELLTYLLFESQNESDYVTLVKAEVSEMFASITNKRVYWAKKSLRKILRYSNRWIKYSKVPETEIEIRVHFCQNLLESGISFQRSRVLQNMYDREVEKVVKLVGKLHEDLQFDYKDKIASLNG